MTIPFAFQAVTLLLACLAAHVLLGTLRCLAAQASRHNLKCYGYWILFGLLTACHQPSKTILDNQHHRVQQETAGQWTLVNYWAPWCESCLREIPQLNHLAANGSVRVLGVSFDEMTEQDINHFATQVNIQYPLLLQDPKIAWHLPNPDVLPTSYLLDEKGHVRKIFLGEQTEMTVLKEIACLKK